MSHGLSHSANSDLVSRWVDHLLEFGNPRHFTEEAFEQKVRLSSGEESTLQLVVEAIRSVLCQKRNSILAEWNADGLIDENKSACDNLAARINLPEQFKATFEVAVRKARVRDLQRLWFSLEKGYPELAGQIFKLWCGFQERQMLRKLVGNYCFTGQKPLPLATAAQVKDTLELLDRLTNQLDVANKEERILTLDLSEIVQFVDITLLDVIEKAQWLLKEQKKEQFTQNALASYANRLLERCFDDLRLPNSQRDASGGGDSPKELCGGQRSNGINYDACTRRHSRCATVILLDMSGSMREKGRYVSSKRGALVLDALIKEHFPQDLLQFVEIASCAKYVFSGGVPFLMPKPVTLFEPVVQLRARLKDGRVTESDVPMHFTNVQHALQLGREWLATKKTPRREIILITDGQPTAHLVGSLLYMHYPPNPLTKVATVREAISCRREGIVIKVYLLTKADQTEDDIQFARDLVEACDGRLILSDGANVYRDLVSDYVKRYELHDKPKGILNT